MDIKNLREEIDQINKEMVALFSKRMDVSEQIARYKQANKLPIRDTERERQLLNKVSDLAGEDMASYTRVLFTTMMDLSRSYQSKHMQEESELGKSIESALNTTEKLFPSRAHVACQGIEGAYSQKACEKMFALPDIMFVNTLKTSSKR
jgi:chorismate mutase/prephenate dehydratase